MTVNVAGFRLSRSRRVGSCATWLCLLGLLRLQCVTGYLLATDSCPRQCHTDFKHSTERLMKTENGVSWQHIFKIPYNAQRRENEDESRRNFNQLCDYYSEALECLQTCPDSEERSTIVKSLSLMKYMCEEKRNEFLKHLPCLTAEEHVVISRCMREITEAGAAIAAIETDARNDPYNKMQMVTTICKHTSAVASCLMAATKDACGPDPVKILRRLVTLGFRSMEDIHNKTDALPTICRDLVEKFDDGKNDRPTSPARRPLPQSSRQEPPFGKESAHSALDDDSSAHRCALNLFLYLICVLCFVQCRLLSPFGIIL